MVPIYLGDECINKKIMLFAVVFLFLMVRSVSAANCGGSTPCNCGDILTSSYNMTSDLTCTGAVNGLTIYASNIILDCQGHKLIMPTPLSLGIYLYETSGNVIKNCIITTNSGGGIQLDTSSNNTITNNTANSNQYGIELSYSSNNTLNSNIANSNGYGIRIWYSSNNTLNSNIANLNTYYGIQLLNSANSTFTGNTVNSNGNNVPKGYGAGIDLTSYSNNNIIYNNYFFNNSINAYDNGNNFWNIPKTLGTNIIGGPYIGGNFWSDYNGIDIDGDGLGNTQLPYNSNGNIAGGDYMPLTAVNIIPPPTITILSPVNTNYSKTSVLLNFTATNSVPISWIGYSLNNGPNVTITGPVNIAAPANMTGSTTLVNGLNNITVYANDTYGVMGSSVMTYFNYCKGDTTGDKKVNVLDLIKVATKLNAKCGDTNYDAAVDLNDDCAINVLDLIVVSSNLNAVC